LSAEIRARRVDKDFLSQFLQNAQQLFATALAAAGEELGRTAILVGQDGAIQMMCNSDWPLESLQRHHGAAQAFLVTRESGSVRLEARSGAQRCSFESETPRQVARRLLSGGAAQFTPARLGIPAPAQVMLPSFRTH
jgi:hypothetical protein